MSQYCVNGGSAFYAPQQQQPQFTTMRRGFNYLHGMPVGYPNVPTPVGSHGTNSSIAQAIQFASNFDFAGGLDMNGQAIAGRLGNFLNGDNESAMTGQELNDLLKNIRPDMDIPHKSHGGGPPGLKYPLYPHQEVALTWMKKMEEGTNKGGILADDMGLGKTISTLALMLSRQSNSRPKASNRFCFVAPWM